MNRHAEYVQPLSLVQKAWQSTLDQSIYAEKGSTARTALPLGTRSLVLRVLSLGMQATKRLHSAASVLLVDTAYR